MECATHFGSDAVTGHQYGLIGQTARTGVVPSQPALRSDFFAYSGPSGSNVHAVSVPSSVGTPSLPRTACDSTLRVMTRESRQYRLHIFWTIGSMAPASAP